MAYPSMEFAGSRGREGGFITNHFCGDDDGSAHSTDDVMWSQYQNRERSGENFQVASLNSHVIYRALLAPKVRTILRTGFRTISNKWTDSHTFFWALERA